MLETILWGLLWVFVAGVVAIFLVAVALTVMDRGSPRAQAWLMRAHRLLSTWQAFANRGVTFTGRNFFTWVKAILARLS